MERDDLPSFAGTAPGRRRTKHQFTVPERYGVWIAHDRQCRLCDEPIEYADLEIDHYFPEYLDDSPDALVQIIADFALPEDFTINSFANWVPACRRYNRHKGTNVLKWTPRNQGLVDENLARATVAARKAQKLKADGSGARTMAQVLVAIEARKLTLADLVELVDDLIVDPTRRNLPNGAVFLGDGRMFTRDEIVKTCVCQCNRNVCVGQDRKMWCIFTTELSDWVVATGLFYACYDEPLACPRCGKVHRRGYIGRIGSCAAPFADQHRRSD